MVTAQSPLARQPDQLDYASPTQFRFGIHQLPKVEFFTVTANIPEISLGIANYPSPFVNIPMMGDKLEYGQLNIGFIVDEYLENYLSLHEWITGIGFPKDRKQFSEFRTKTASMPGSPSTPNKADLKPGSPGAVLPRFSDATLSILSNKNNPIVEVTYRDIFPVSLSALEYNQEATDVEYLRATAEFAYQLYEIKSL